MENEPLFKPGFVDISLEQIDELFVKPFDEPNQREFLAEHLKAFLSKLQGIGIGFEIWIDGSFASRKAEPADIDIAVFFDSEKVNNLNVNKKSELNYLFGNPSETKIRYKLDLYFIPNEREEDRSYWRGWFGFTRDEQPKGIPRINM